MRKRRTFTADFKATVALAALRGERTLAELATQYGVHPTLIAKWKQQAPAGLAEVFADKRRPREATHEAEVRDLHAKIGQLTVEKDCLARGFRR